MSLIPNQGRAQTDDHLLGGLSKISIVIEDLHTADRQCGLTDVAIRSAIMYPLSSTKLGVVSSSEAAFYVNINTLFLTEDKLCFSNVLVKVYSYADVKLTFSGSTKVAEVLLWDSGSVLYSNLSSHARYIRDDIEEKVKSVITDWNLDNKPNDDTRR
jgi:hypothetical protein